MHPSAAIKTDRDRVLDHSRKLLRFAWGIESIAAAIGLFVGMALAIDAYTRAVGAPWLDMVLGALPLVMVSAAEFTKIPIAMTIFRSGWVWKPIFMAALCGLALITFETVFFGLERNFALRAREVENARAEVVRLEAEIANQLAKKADLESRSYRERLEQDADRETQSARERLRSIDGELEQLEADELPPKARLLKDQIEAKRKDKAALEDRRAAEKQGAQKAFEGQRDSYVARIRQAHAAGDGNYARQMQNELRRLPSATRRHAEIDATFAPQISKSEKEIAALEAELRAIPSAGQGPNAARKRKLQEQRDIVLAELASIDKKYQSAREDARAAEDRQRAEVEGTATKIDDLQIRLADQRQRVAELTVTNQIYRMASRLAWLAGSGEVPAEAVTKEKAELVAVVWFGTLAALAALAGVVVTFAAMVLEHVAEHPRRSGRSGERLKASVRRLVVGWRKRRVRTIEKPIEVPVEKVVTVEKPVRTLVKEMVHVPFFTDDPELLRRKLGAAGERPSAAGRPGIAQAA